MEQTVQIMVAQLFSMYLLTNTCNGCPDALGLNLALEIQLSNIFNARITDNCIVS